MKFPRWIQRWYARLFGYYWQPCPLCGEMFGGHEWRSYELHGLPGTIPCPDRPEGCGTGICPACTLAGKGYEMPPRRYVS